VCDGGWTSVWRDVRWWWSCGTDWYIIELRFEVGWGGLCVTFVAEDVGMIGGGREGEREL
jgi:hypothetical protein